MKMKLYFLSNVNLKGAANAAAMYTIDGKKAIKDDCCMAMLDKRHRHRFFQNRTKGEQERSLWTSALLRMCYAFHVDGKTIPPAQTIQLS